MRARRKASAVLGLASVITAVPPLAGTSSASAAAAQTCVEEFSGQAFGATVVGTDAPERFGPDEPFPRTLRNNDVLVAAGGDDAVDVRELAGLTICLGGGMNQVVTGDQATSLDGLGFSIRAGEHGDTVSGTPYNDVVRGGDPLNDFFPDPSSSDSDICRQFETLVNCEIVNPPF